MTKDTMTRREAAKAVGVHQDTLSRLLNGVLAAAVLERKGRGGALVLSRPAIEVYAAVMKERRPLDPQHERARRDAASADMAEHRLSVARGEFLPADEVERVWSGVVAAVRSKLLAVPDFLTDNICRAFELDGQAGIYSALKTAMREALNEMAAPEFLDDDPTPPAKKTAKRKRRRKAKARKKTKTPRRKKAKKTRTK